MCTCVRFSDNNGNMYFGRNLDWSTGFGERVVITPRAYRYHSPFRGELSPTYAVIGMGIVADDVPLYFDCGNEKGLAVAGLNFPGYARYEPAPLEGKVNIAAYEFPLWVAMSFATVDEVEEALQDVALVDHPLDDTHPVSLLHWMVGDGKRSIVVEYTEAGMQVFHNGADVLANQPGYAWHRENLRNYMNLSSAFPEKASWGGAEMTAYGSGAMMRGLPGDYYSPSRFVRVAYLNTHYPCKEGEGENVSRLFHTLAGVAMIDGAAAMGNGDFERTVYTGGFSARTATYYWNTYDDPSIRSVALADYAIDGSELVTL